MSKPEKILAQELLEREVMDLSAGEIIGSIVDFAMTRVGQVTQIGILPLSWYRGGLGITPNAITSVNDERVCIADGSTLAEFQPDNDAVFATASGNELNGKQVLTEAGELLGELVDFSFSLDDGKVLDLLVVGENDKKVRVPVESIQTIGRDYIVFNRGVQGVAGEDAEGQPSGKASAAAETAATPVTEKTAKSKQKGKAKASEPQSEKPEQAEQAPVAEPEVAIKPPEVAEPEVEDDVADAAATPEPTRTEEKDALFGDGSAPPELSKFDEKKREFLRGRPAHRVIKANDDTVIAEAGVVLDDAALNKIISSGLLGEVFIEMTLKK